jgi:hypothetical protein
MDSQHEIGNCQETKFAGSQFFVFLLLIFSYLSRGSFLNLSSNIGILLMPSASP